MDQYISKNIMSLSNVKSKYCKACSVKFFQQLLFSLRSNIFILVVLNLTESMASFSQIQRHTVIKLIQKLIKLIQRAIFNTKHH